MSTGMTDMDERLVLEQLAGSSTNGKAEPTHVIQIDPDPKPGHPKIRATTRSNWLNQLQKHKEEERPKQVKGTIHRVPYILRSNLKPEDKCYAPKVVSLGPYHFGEDGRKKFQDLKPSIADKLVPDKELQASMRSEIRKNIHNLMDAYSTGKMKNEALSTWEEMFFLDGCFVLHFIFCILFNRVEDLGIKAYDIDSIHSDLFLAENQLPFDLLKILSGNDQELLSLIDDYIYTHKISNDDVDHGRGQDEPVHLLDRLRTIIIGGKSETRKGHQAICGLWRCVLPPPVLPAICGLGLWQRESTPPPGTKRTMLPAICGLWQSESTPPSGTKGIALRNAKELSAKGIHFKCNRTGFLKDIFFRSHYVYGTVRLPKIIVDNSTRLLFLNLAAYEMSAGTDSTITSYICFLDSLVNHADDIKELQSAGVLVNHLATDDLAANLFNEMSQGLNLHPDKDTYKDAKWKIHEFFKHKTKANFASWVAEGYHNHFKTPLTAIAFFAAFLALGLTATQTYFTIFPRGG